MTEEPDQKIFERQLNDLVLAAEDVEDVALSDVEDEDEDEDYVAKPVRKPSPSRPPSPLPSSKEETSPPTPPPSPVPEKFVSIARAKKPKTRGKAIQKVFQLDQDSITPPLKKYKPGFFISRTDKLAAKKCFTQICRSEHGNEPCVVIFLSSGKQQRRQGLLVPRSKGRTTFSNSHPQKTWR